LQGWD